MSFNSKSMKCTVAALALAAAAFSVTPAGASVMVKIQSDGFGGTMEVTSKDGKTWTDVVPGEFTMPVKINLGITNGKPFTYWIEQNGTLIHQVGEFVYKDAESHIEQTFEVTGSTENFVFDKPMIVDGCNKLGAPTEKREFWYSVELGLTGLFTTWNGNDYPPYTGYGLMPVKVVCKPALSQTDDLAHDFGEFDVENVKLFLTTYQNNQPGSNPGTVCPALKVTSRAEANQAGPVTMKIWRQKDGGPITSEVKQAWASFDAAKNGYFATYEKWEDVGTTSYFQYKTEIVEAGPFGPFDGWKDITVHCTSPGGGGLAPLPPVNPDLPKPQAKWQGDVIVADSAGHDKSCPRKGQVFFEVTRAAPGDFDYRISCSNGAFFTGTATGYDQGSGVFEAYGAHDLSINRTRSIQCTLQELQPAPVTVAVDKEDFTCNNPAIDPDADDVTSDPPPNTAKPIFPAVIVTPEPKECGRGEKLVRGKCVGKPDVSILCKPGFELVGKKCIRKPVIADKCKRDEIRVNGKCVKKPGVSIHCLPGYKQVGKKCVKKPVIVDACKRNEQRIGGKCVKKPEVSILCKKGFRLVGKSCVRIPTVTKNCGRGEKLVRGNCVKKPEPAPLKTFVAPKPKRDKASTFKSFEMPKARRQLRRTK